MLVETNLSMLNDNFKVRTLWKGSKGWGSTHPERETFEELYRSFEKLSANSILTYGDLLPRESTDAYFEEVKNLDSTNPVLYHKESSFKTVALVKKYTDFTLTKISSNCDHAFAILDENGKQIENIIPFDFSDTGLYNIILKTQDDEEIAWGSCDWLVDVDSSLLTFNNGVPAGVSAKRPPKLTFYQYVGPVGERHYIDAALFDLSNLTFKKYEPVLEITSQLSKYLDNIEKDFFKTHKFSGTDTTQGVGLQYNLLTTIVDTITGDVVKGYDDNSLSQVVSLLSHKEATSLNPDCEIKFVSEDVTEGNHKIVVTAGDIEAVNTGLLKIDLEDGFVVVQAIAGTYDINVTSSDKATATLLVKDNVTQKHELFYPRNDLTATVKVPVFVDLIKLPPHMKLTTLSSYSDQIIPQYYGPRTVDFVIASENTDNNRSADYIVYNKDNFYLADALIARKGNHILLRNGTYKNSENLLELPEITLSGETSNDTTIDAVNLSIKKAVVENITFKDCAIAVTGAVLFKNCTFENTNIDVKETAENVVFRDCRLEELIADGKGIQLFNSTVLKIAQTGELSLYNSSVANTLSHDSTEKLTLYGSYVNSLENIKGAIFINTGRIEKLNIIAASEDSVISTTNIAYVENLPDSIKLDTSYVTAFSDKVTRRIYPDEATVPYYSAFNRRVYAKLPKPFEYSEETNEIKILLDSIEHTIVLNEKGELKCNLTAKHISLASPDNLKTQIEDVYGEHADTRIETDKPTNLEEALIELFWSKADLKNGKIPIDQLPDSIAAGGLALAGMWSFEDHDGAYPTFDDCDLSNLSDDNYTGLQNGWFFIVEASKQEDDPCYPQKAVDDEEYTAGDWVIYSNGKWHKLDRAYLDPVYSRLPALAPVTNGENVAWSIDNGGTGLLDLQYKSLAEALRLINEQLLKLSPDRSASIQEIEVVVDTENTTAELQEFIEVETGFQLNQLTQEQPKICYKAEDGKVVAFTQKGVHDNLPLEHAFYCGTSSLIKVLDNTVDITDDCNVDRFDPYQKYRLGFRYPTAIDAAEITGVIGLAKGAHKLQHTVKYTQYDLQKPEQITTPKDYLEGETKSLTFEERKFYDFKDCSIQKCEANSVNLRVLNTFMEENRTGGYGFLPIGSKVTGEFLIKNFTKYGTISLDAGIQLKAYLGDIEVPVEITSQYFTLTDADQEIYDLNVSFVTELPEVDYAKDSFLVKAIATNFGESTLWTTVLALNDLIVINKDKIPAILESAGSVIYPEFGADIETQFGAEYTPKTIGFVSQNPELVYDEKGYGWPVKATYVNNLGVFDESTYVDAVLDGVNVDNKLYKFVTFKCDLPEIHDLCGFNLQLLWDDKKPKIATDTGLLEDVILQVCPTSNELKLTKLLNANAAVPVFYEIKLDAMEPCNYAGKSTSEVRHITFGRKPLPVQTIYVRVGIAKDSGLFIKGVKIIEE